MAPLSSLLPRVEEPPQNSPGLSIIAIVGIVVISVAVIGLVVLLAPLFIRRRQRDNTEDDVGSIEKAPRMMELQPYIEKGPLPADLQAIQPPSGLNRSVSRHNITLSTILPSPVPPVPAARPCRPKPFEPPTTLNRPPSAAEIVAHHQSTGTMPRPFMPLPAAAAGPFSFALNASPTRPSFPRLPDASGARTSVVSISRLSILGGSVRSASLRSSFASAATCAGSAPGAAELLKVRHLFTPLLPDELVLRANEKVTLIQAYDDGWCVVGRKSAFAAQSPLSPAAYAFGQGKNARGGVDEVEIGAVPSWVFEKRAKMDRPMRSSSLGITLVLDEGERGAAAGGARDDVISWSNF